MKLTASNVVNIFQDCLPKNESLPEDKTIEVEGIVTTALFNKEKLAEHKNEICSLLAELPESFQKSKGGGMSFLNMCMDKDGNLWTGEQRTMHFLLLLGLGVGKITYPLPQAMWTALPGGMPYITIED